MIRSALSRLLRRPHDSEPARVPDGVRIYAIGDVHGRLDLLERLIDRIREDLRVRTPARVELILLGDLIDRGPDSAGVVERAMALASDDEFHVSVLAGNHEEVFLRALAGDARAMKLLVRIGGRATLTSYGVTDAEYGELDYPELTALLAERVPPEHVAFIERFDDSIVIGDYIFVHAGIRPGVALEAQKTSDLRWIRDEFLGHKGAHGGVIVHGHSITEDVDRQANRIGIDTGAFASGRLTALALEGADSWVIQT